MGHDDKSQADCQSGNSRMPIPIGNFAMSGINSAAFSIEPSDVSGGGHINRADLPVRDQQGGVGNWSEQDVWSVGIVPSRNASRWPMDEYTEAGLPPPDVTNPEALAAFQWNIQTNYEERACWARLLDGEAIPPGQEIRLSAPTYGLWAGIMMVDIGNRRFVVNLSLDGHSPRARLNTEDYQVMQAAYQASRDDVVKPLTSGVLPVFEWGKTLPYFVTEGCRGFKEINWLSGSNAKDPLPEDVSIILNGTPENTDYILLTGDDSECMLTRMQSLVARIFIGSDEELLVAPQVQSGDFIALTGDLGDSEPEIAPLKLVTCRANMLHPEEFAYGQVTGSDPLGKSSIFDCARRGIKIAKAYVLDGEDQAVLGQIADYPEKLSPRQKLLLSPLLHDEFTVQAIANTFPGRHAASVTWPVPTIVVGIECALAGMGIGKEERAAWWKKGTENPLEGIQKLNTLLGNNPRAVQVIDGIQRYPYMTRDVMQRLLEAEKAIQMLVE